MSNLLKEDLLNILFLGIFITHLLTSTHAIFCERTDGRNGHVEIIFIMEIVGFSVCFSGGTIYLNKIFDILWKYRISKIAIYTKKNNNTKGCIIYRRCVYLIGRHLPVNKTVNLSVNLFLIKVQFATLLYIIFEYGPFL